MDPMTIGSLGKVAESLTGGGAGPTHSGPATQGGAYFANGGLSIAKPNYAMWAIIGLVAILGFKLLAKKK